MTGAPPPRGAPLSGRPPPGGPSPGGGPLSGSGPPPTTRPTILLASSDIRRLVTITDVIGAVGQAAREHATGPISRAPRVSVPGGGTLLMAAASAERGGVAAKIVSIAPGNRATGLATIQGLAAWFDHATRQPLLVADATAMTALRTGALSGAATEALAPLGASVLAMVGVGGQARCQVEAVAAVRPIEQVRLVSLRRASAEQFGQELCAVLPGRRISVFGDVAAAVRDADIVCLATTSTAALIEQADLQPGAHVNAVGAYRPDMREVGVSVFRAASVVCADDREGALSEAGDLMDAVALGVLDPASLLELGMIMDRPGSQPANGAPTVFKSVGSAAADLALLDLLLQRAQAEPSLPTIDFAR